MISAYDFVILLMLILINSGLTLAAIFLYSQDIEKEFMLSASDVERVREEVTIRSLLPLGLSVIVLGIITFLNIFLYLQPLFQDVLQSLSLHLFQHLPLFELVAINCYFSLLIVISVLDYRYHLIPLQLCFVLLCLGILGSQLWSLVFMPTDNIHSLLWSSVSAAGFYLCLVSYDFLKIGYLHLLSLFQSIRLQELRLQEPRIQKTNQRQCLNKENLLQGSQTKNMLGEGDYWLFISLSIYLYSTQLPHFLLIASFTAILVFVSRTTVFPSICATYKAIIFQNKFQLESPVEPSILDMRIDKPPHNFSTQEVHIPFAPYLCFANGILVLSNFI